MKHSIKTKAATGALALMMIAAAVPATHVHAATTAELQAQITALMNQINALQAQLGTTNNTTYTQLNLTRNLSQGMTGADVQSLQRFLNSDPDTRVAVTGAGSVGNETTFFGPATKAAVITFQNKYRTEVLAPDGLTSGTGFVGASTRAHIAKLGMTSTPTTPTTPDQGADEDEDDVDTPTVSEEGDITVERGNEHSSTLEMSGGFDPIYSVEVEAEDSDMTISRIDFMFDKRPWNYVDSFTLHLDGKEIADVKASSATITSVGNEYRLRFTGLKAVVEKGETGEFVLEAKALNSISSTRVNDSLSVYVPRNGIRATDTAKLTTQAPNNNLAARSFDFRDASEDGELKVSLNTNSPKSGSIAVKTNSNSVLTDVMIVDLKADDSDIDVEELFVKVESSESNVTNVVRSLSLVHDGDTLMTETVRRNSGNDITGRDSNGNSYVIIATGEYYVHFDDIRNLTIDEDEREALTIAAVFYKQSGRYSSGTDVTFTLRAIEGENENREDVVAGDLTTGANRTFDLFTDGLTFAYVSDSADTKGQLNQTGEYKLSFDITAYGDDIYVPTGIDRNVGATTSATIAAIYSVIDGDNNRYDTGVASDAISIDTARLTGGYYRLTEGSTYRVTIDVALQNAGATAGFYGIALDQFNYRVGSATGTWVNLTTGFTDLETDLEYVRN